MHSNTDHAEEAPHPGDLTPKGTIDRMVTWTDSLGRGWRMVPTIGSVLKLRRVYGIDLLAPKVTGPNSVNDILATVEVVLEEQLAARMITIDDLANDLFDDIELVYQALSEGLVLFFWAHQPAKIGELMGLKNSTTPKTSGRLSS